MRLDPSLGPTPYPAATALLAGRRALVTGAAGAIGAAVVQAFARHGAEVVATDLAPQAGMAACDVTDEASVEAAFAAAGPLTDVVHCAGMLSVGPVAATGADEARRAVEVNLLGAFLVGRAAARRLSQGGALTFLASQAGFRAGANWGLYCAAKAGVLRLAEALAQELGPHGVRVNSVCPGSVESPMLHESIARLGRLGGGQAEAVRARYVASVPLGRLAEPAEVADVCAFLASPLARYVSGAAIPVDGGEVSA